MRFANAIYPLFSTNCDVYVQGKALFELFSADDGYDVSMLHRLVGVIHAFLLHPQSFAPSLSPVSSILKQLLTQKDD